MRVMAKSPNGHEFEVIGHPPKVFLAGRTHTDTMEVAAYLAYRRERWSRQPEDRHAVGGSPTDVVELGGRVCYMSFDNAKSRTHEGYLQDSLIKRQHGSVLEHVSFNLLCADVPRDVQLEMVRHRAGTGYSWESTRYTDKHLRFCLPPALRGNHDAIDGFVTGLGHAVDAYYATRAHLTVDQSDDGTLDKKRVTEGSRPILPGSRASDGMVTLNGRALRHIVALRTGMGADRAMREFAYALYKACSDEAPALVADAEELFVDHCGNVPVVVFAHGAH